MVRAGLGFVALAILLILMLNHLAQVSGYSPDRLSAGFDGGKPSGFYEPQVDAAGNRYVWTSRRVGIEFSSGAALPFYR